MHLLRKIGLITLLLASLISNVFSAVAEDFLRTATDYLNQGHYYLALQEAERLLESTSNHAELSLAYGIKGNSLLIMQRYSEAKESLLKAMELAEEKKYKASYANSLGVIEQKLHDNMKARHFFQLAAEYVENDPVLKLRIKLNQLHIRQERIDPEELKTTLSEISAVSVVDERVRFYLNLAAIARMHELSVYTPIIQYALEHADRDSVTTKDQSLRIEVLDSLAELYESQGKTSQALALSELASAQTQQAEVDDLMIQLEWRKGRLYQQQGRDNDALVAFGKAVDYVQAIRRDIPVYYEDGQSSFRKTLEPIYLGYTNQLLKKADQQSGETRQQTLMLARQTVELIKQSELEDFLGGRCLIEGLKRSELDDFDTLAAIVYPIILDDRLELLLGIGKTIRQFSIDVPREALRVAISDLSSQLRKWILAPGDVDDSEAYRQPAENLYRWIIAPIERELQNAGIKTIVIVPDSVLRLVPFAALFDGNKFLIEKYAVSVSPGLSLLGNKDYRPSVDFRALLAGVSKPGPVTEKLSLSTIDNLLFTKKQHADQQVVTRGLSDYRIRGPIDSTQFSNGARQNEITDLALQAVQRRLSLPDVETELSNLEEALDSKLLLNEQFTIANFSEQLSKQSFDIVHIASHGFFSSDADKSFIMAFDDIMKLDDLKSFLKQRGRVKKGIQLLTFSACETAEGDDRAPLGFAGAALKADAQSALGSLWPIEDGAASQLMISFYRNLIKHHSKAEALRQAQLELLRTEHRHHPGYWSPFILVGNWL